LVVAGWRPLMAPGASWSGVTRESRRRRDVSAAGGVGLGVQATLLLDDCGAVSARGSSVWAGPGAGRAGPGWPTSGTRARAHPRIEAANGTAAQRGGAGGVSWRARRSVPSAASLCARCRGLHSVGSRRQQRCGPRVGSVGAVRALVPAPPPTRARAPPRPIARAARTAAAARCPRRASYGSVRTSSPCSECRAAHAPTRRKPRLAEPSCRSPAAPVPLILLPGPPTHCSHVRSPCRHRLATAPPVCRAPRRCCPSRARLPPEHRVTTKISCRRRDSRITLLRDAPGAINGCRPATTGSVCVCVCVCVCGKGEMWNFGR